MTNKRSLGQYYTTNADYILSDMTPPDKNINIIEPFAGQGDLEKWVGRPIDKYDIAPQDKYTKSQDTLTLPPNYKDSFVLTNPPFLARNKSKDKKIYDLYKTDDLYKAFLLSVINGDALGGIVILPLNFFCSSDATIRNKFFEKYKVDNLNIFETPVFNDTTYTVCSFQFSRNIVPGDKFNIITTTYPHKKKSLLEIKKSCGWRVGGEFFEFISKSKDLSLVKINRLIIGDTHQSNIFLRASDSGGIKKISLENRDTYYGKLSDRMFASLYIEINKIPITKEETEFLIMQFNKHFNYFREKYNSLFLPTYRNSTTYVRKRVPFEIAYQLIIKILMDKYGSIQTKSNK